MKRIHSLVLAAAIILIQMFGVGAGAVSAAVTDDIIIYGYNVSDNNIVKDDEFTIIMSCQNTSGEALTNVYLTIDSGTSFHGAVSNTVKLPDIAAADTPNFPILLALIYKGTGDELNFTLKYLKGTEECAQSQAVYIKEVQPSDETPGEPIDTTKFTAALNTVGTGLMPVISGGKPATLAFTVKNTGNAAAVSLTASLSMEDMTKAVLIFDTLNLTQTIDLININETKNLTFQFSVLKSAPAGVYPVKIKYHYLNYFNNVFETTEIVYIKVVNGNTPPRLIVEGISVSPVKAEGTGAPAVSDGSLAGLIVKFRNLGTLSAIDVKMTLKGLKSGGLTTYNSTDVRHVDEIEGNGPFSVLYTLFVPDSMPAGSGELTVRMDFKDELGNSYTEENQIFMPDSFTGNKRPELVINGIQSANGAITPNQDFDISFNVGNNGSSSAKNVKVWLTNDSVLVSKSLSTIVIDRIDSGVNKNVKFTLFATDDAITKNYPVAVNVEYEDLSGAKSTVTQYIGIYVDNDAKKSTPRIIISAYAFEPAEVKAGEDFNLKLSFLNTSRTADVSNIKVTLTSDDGTFTPVSGSNTFFIDAIPMNKSIDKEILLHSKSDAEPKSYTVSVNFEYEDSKGNPFIAKETVSIPVKQNPRLVTGELNIPPESFAGQPISIYMDFYNMGKSILYNLIVTVDGNFEGQNTNYFVGNFNPGSNDYYEASVVPTNIGAQSGSVLFTFEDASGNPIEVRKEFSVNITEMIDKGGSAIDGGVIGKDGEIIDPGMQPPEAKGGFLRYAIIIGAVLLVAAAAVFFILKRKHAVRKGMTLDE